MSANFEKVFEKEKENNQKWLQLRHSTEFICRKCFGDHRTRDCSNLQENNAILSDINRICVYYDPFVADPNKNTTCDSSCNWRHFTQDEFMNFCASKIKDAPTELKEIAHEYFMHHNWMCLYYSSWQLMEEYPDNPKYIRLYARALDRLGDYKNADRYYRKAIDGAATDDRSFREYAVFLHHGTRQLSAANAFYQTALRLSDENPTTHCEYAQLLEDEEFKGKDYKAAEYHYKRSLELAPFHLKSLYHLALFYRYKWNNLELARKYFDKLCSLDYNYRTYWFHDQKLYSHHYIAYASLLKEMEDYEKAIFYFNVALEKVWPHNDLKAEIYFNIGLIIDNCKGSNLLLKDNKGYPYELNHERWYFEQASILNEKMYGMFYNEYLEHHKLTRGGNNLHTDDANIYRATNSYSKSTTAYNPMVSHSDITINTYEHTKNLENKTNDTGKYHQNKYLESNANVNNCNGYTSKYLENCETPKNLKVHSEKWTKTKESKMQADKEAFKNWIDGLQLNVDYYSMFEDCGIVTFESFYQIQTIDELLGIIGEQNEWDANMMWDSTPKDYDTISLQKLHI